MLFIIMVSFFFLELRGGCKGLGAETFQPFQRRGPLQRQ